jgi:hypothetical protein
LNPIYGISLLIRETNVADGDSGSWVLRNSKVCGCIFARLDGLPWGYMLPIEPILKEISRVYSIDGNQVKVQIPDAHTMEHIKSGTSSEIVSAQNSDVRASPETPMSKSSVSPIKEVALLAPTDATSTHIHHMQNSLPILSRKGLAPPAASMLASSSRTAISTQSKPTSHLHQSVVPDLEMPTLPSSANTLQTGAASSEPPPPISNIPNLNNDSTLTKLPVSSNRHKTQVPRPYHAREGSVMTDELISPSRNNEPDLEQQTEGPRGI